ncbi:SRPBCC family protein [Kitasatospora sp. HPMI-4]|uniref:SRPBCC family protein n=1 Tax=Kitasatospora sp. HPMI-4 TaxID=3448443 RepID=UPI003F1E0FF9
MAREFTVNRQYELSATPEQVWSAVATGPGIIGWLYPMEVEPRVGGVVSRGPCTVLEWDPPRRFVCRYANDEGFSNTLHYYIDGRGNGTSKLDMGIHWVHEGVVDDRWDTKADAAQKHVDFYQHSLQQYLRYFDGRPAAYIRAEQPKPPTGPEVFATLRRRLGISEDTAVGDALHLEPRGIHPLDVVVDYLSEDFVGLRSDHGLYRFFNGSAWNWPVWLGHHLFAADVDQERATQAWSKWLEDV